MKKVFFVFMLLIFSAFVYGQIPALQWAKTTERTLYGVGSGIVADATGNVYTLGNFQGLADFDPGPGTYNLNGPGLDDISILKLNAAGNFVWARQLGGASEDQGYSIAMDASGNIYTTGKFSGTADFDPGLGVYNLTAIDSFDVFICKLDSAGNFLWARSAGGTSDDIAYALALDGANNVYVTGNFIATADFDLGPAIFNLTSSGLEDIFILKLDSLGNFKWAKKIGGTWWDFSKALAVDPSGNILITGQFNTVVDFDPGPAVFNLNAQYGSAVFILKLDSAGDFVWAKELDGYSNYGGESIVSDASGNVLVTGDFSGVIDFDPGQGVFNITSGSGAFADIFILKLDAAGNFTWAKNIKGSSDKNALSITVDQYDNIYTSGFFWMTADFDPGPGTYSLSSALYADIFISKLDPFGNFMWAARMGGPASDEGKNMTTDASGNFYLAGFFSNTVDFDPGPASDSLTSSTAFNMFILKFTGCSAPLAPIDVTPPGNELTCVNSVTTLSVQASGNVLWFSSPVSAQVLSVGSSYVTPPLNAGNTSFYAEAVTCTNSAARTVITVTSDVCTGFENNSSGADALIYPNPFNASATIVLSRPVTHAAITIYDALGRKIKEINNIYGSRIVIERAGLLPGIYYYKLSRDTVSAVTTGNFIISE